MRGRGREAPDGASLEPFGFVISGKAASLRDAGNDFLLETVYQVINPEGKAFVFPGGENPRNRSVFAP